MTIAVYAGSFDPITAGHESIVRQAARIFSHVRVLVAVNPNKDVLFETDERVKMIGETFRRMPQVSVDATDGLVVEYARDMGASYLIRGVRGATDAEYETGLAQANREIAPEVTTIMLPAEPSLSELSSSGLKERVRSGQDVKDLCAPAVAQALERRLLPTEQNDAS